MKQLTRYYAGRDMIGVRPLYTVDNQDVNNNIDMYSSEIKLLLQIESEVKP
jgi:asparagine synthetase B (glutamine-hydrolysing)